MDLSQSLVPPQSDKDVEEARFELKYRVRDLRKCKYEVSTVGRPWHKESCKGLLSMLRRASSLENLEQWYTDQSESELQKNVHLDFETISLIKKVYGTYLAWCLANFPDLDWFLHPRRAKAYAELLEAVIEFGDDAKSTAPTTTLPAPHVSPTGHPPSTLVAVEDTQSAST
jgi:hypothetical protein